MAKHSRRFNLCVLNSIFECKRDAILWCEELSLATYGIGLHSGWRHQRSCWGWKHQHAHETSQVSFSGIFFLFCSLILSLPRNHLQAHDSHIHAGENKTHCNLSSLATLFAIAMAPGIFHHSVRLLGPKTLTLTTNTSEHKSSLKWIVL